MLGQLLVAKLRERASLGHRGPHEPGDGAVGLAEGHSRADEQVGDVDGGDHLVGRGRGQALAVEGDALEHPARGGERQGERVGRVEEVLLVLLHVLVVGQRKAVHARRAARQGAPRSRGAFARSSSAASGFFFCGMIEEPDVHASASSQKPNSSLLHSTSSAPRRERCVAAVAAAAR